jgi:hypothetical protein
MKNHPNVALAQNSMDHPTHAYKHLKKIKAIPKNQGSKTYLDFPFKYILPNLVKSSCAQLPIHLFHKFEKKKIEIYGN